MTSSQSLVSGLNRISMYTGRVDMMSYSSCFRSFFSHNMDNYHVNQCKTAIVVPPAPLSSFRVFLLNLFADSSSISILGLSETINRCFCCLCVSTLLIVQQEGTWNNGTWQQIQKYKAFFNCAQLKKEKKNWAENIRRSVKTVKHLSKTQVNVSWIGRILGSWTPSLTFLFTLFKSCYFPIQKNITQIMSMERGWGRE